MNALVHDGFDGATVADLEELLGRDGVALLMKAFAQELQLRPARVLAEAAAGRPARARFEAHYLKGAALSLGASGVAEAAAKVEAAPDADVADRSRALAQLARSVQAGMGPLAAAA